MTTEASQLAEFKQRLAATLKDLQHTAQNDGEAMAIIGAMAGELLIMAQKPTWTATKNAMSAEDYRSVLEAFDAKGNEHIAAGETRQAYAIQAIATSLVARSHSRDAQIAQGEKLLDAIIEHVVVIYLREKARRSN